MSFLGGLWTGCLAPLVRGTSWRLLVGALSGALYALTPSLEEAVYDHQLHVPASQSSMPLAEQIRAAQQVVGYKTPSSVRPAPTAGNTTRVMFAEPSLGESKSRAIFISPADGQVRGDLTVYGTSGVLPMRTWIEDLHRTLHLGAAGRYYSELAASWLWVIAVAGLFLWFNQLVSDEPTTARAFDPGRHQPVNVRTLSLEGFR